MKKFLIFLFYTLIFTTTSANTSDIKNKFFSTIEDFLEGNFEDTDFSIKSKDGLNKENQELNLQRRNKGKQIQKRKGHIHNNDAILLLADM